MKKLKWIILILIIIIFIIFLLIFFKKLFKELKIGNNMSSQEIVDYILNISSYNANITIEVNSNKNSNKYIINQEYISPNSNKQEIIEPSNIAGVRIIKDENGITVENTKLNLSNIYENYDYITDNCLDLSTFINDYNNSSKSKYEEKDGQIVMKTESQNSNIYTKYKTLYVDKEKRKPIRLEVKDNNKKCKINIQYNKVEIN